MLVCIYSSFLIIKLPSNFLCSLVSCYHLDISHPLLTDRGHFFIIILLDNSVYGCAQLLTLDVSARNANSYSRLPWTQHDIYHSRDHVLLTVNDDEEEEIILLAH